MKRKHIVVFIAVMLCASLAGGAAAQSSGPNVPEAAVTTKFTHQGQIKRNGVLFDGTCNMRFTLWDAATAGVQQASYTVPAPVTVNEGVFAVEVDFGAQFKGEARWIQTETQCADDASYQNLPRVALNPTPYAIGLMPGAIVNGNLACCAVFRANNTSVGGTGLWGSSTNNAGVYGESATGWGVYGYSPSGWGVYGKSGTGAGVVGESANFNGVRGLAHNVNHGAVVGIHDGGGFGVYGSSPTGAGVVGVSTSWVGVYGESTSQTAVWGKSANATGVYGSSTAHFGVYGESTNYEGVRGTSHHKDHGGVVGVNDAAGGIAVYGIAPNGGYAAWFNGRTKTNVVEITGGSDLAERFATADNTKVEPGTVMVIDENHSGKLKVSDGAYDGKVIGIVSGAGGINTGLTLHQEGALEGDLVVAIAGRVYCQAEAHAAPIKPGDLLTTSSVKGYCMKATDRDQAYGAVIGKALTALDRGEGLVLVIVNLQ